MTVSKIEAAAEIPKSGLAGLKESWRSDIVSGFIVFLIALPLSLGIAMASGVPPMAGIIAAIVGGILVSRISGSFITINGPAAGLIVVIVGSVDRLGGGEVGYHATLAAIVVSGLILFVMGLCRAGLAGQFFPTAAVHGMLAAIGMIIVAKQLHVMLGVKPEAREPLALFAELPRSLANLNPEIALIGFVSLALLIGYTLIKNRTLKRLPAPILVVVVAVALGRLFQLDSCHDYLFCGHSYALDPKNCLVQLPARVVEGIAHPDFGQMGSAAFWMSVLSITLVQGIETLLSASAVDKLDRFRRRSDLSRDMAAVGLGSAVSASIGGLPMIAEIVRSSANINNGARTSWSNFFHGAFMLLAVVIAGPLICRIPLAALAALLVFTGYQLASPRVFAETHRVGREQTLIFVTTIVVTLLTDLLIGVFTGIAVKLLLHLYHGATFKELYSADVKVDEEEGGRFKVEVGGAAVFTNWVFIQRALDAIPAGRWVVVDLSGTRLIDHTVMERLHHYADEYARAGGKFDVTGLDQHKTGSHHRLSARRLSEPRSNGVEFHSRV